MTEANAKTDILIAGGGFAGLALAIALRQGSDGALSVTLADPAMDRASGDPRASAIAAAARRLFETIGVWPAIAAGAQPILDMVVTDSKARSRHAADLSHLRRRDRTRRAVRAYDRERTDDRGACSTRRAPRASICGRLRSRNSLTIRRV